MDMVAILRNFLRVERTGQWKIHLQAVSDMFPCYAAAGHNNYMMSARLYLR